MQLSFSFDNVNTIYNDLKKYEINIPFHEYQLGVLYCYKNLPKLSENKIIFESNGFKINNDFWFTEEVSENEIIKKLRQGLNVNAINNYKNSVKRKEVCYDLNNIFLKEYYKDKKKYKKRVAYPMNYFKKNDYVIKELNINDLHKYYQLHDKWLKRKLENPNVFRNLFPSSRYKRCIEYTFNNDDINIKTIGVFNNEHLFALRTIYINSENKAFDLAFITDENKEISDFSEYCNINLLSFIKEKYKIEFFNCGLSEGKLKDYKKHYPNYETIYYRYTNCFLKTK